MAHGQTFVGTAGWAIPKGCAHEFPVTGSSLERYAARFNAAEINSSFHRRHRASTWERWATSVPANFRFSVKLPKTITHDRRMAECDALLDEFFADTEPLQEKMSVVLVQLPPSLALQETFAEPFFRQLRRRAGCDLVCEPRHASWFQAAADELLARHEVGRVAADPAKFTGAANVGGSANVAYWRLHGSPVIYRSSYDDARLIDYAKAAASTANASRWLIFDNTASGAATDDALRAQQLLRTAN